MPIPTMYPTNRVVAANTTNATVVKAAAGYLKSATIANSAAAARYVKFYDKASAPTVGTDVPVLTIQIPANGSVQVNYDDPGFGFGLGITYGIVNLPADSDTTAPTAGDVIMTVQYY